MSENLTVASCFRVNTPGVVHDVIDGEAVFVSLRSGSYYSTDKVGAEVWSLVAKGASLGQIVDQLSKRYEGNREDIVQGITALLTELQEEELIVPDARVQLPKGTAFDDAAKGQGTERAPFETPRLHKYSDMEDLLLLDPIHDVDERGWPNVPPHKS